MNEKENTKSQSGDSKLTHRQEYVFTGIFLLMAGLLVLMGLYRPSPTVYSFTVSGEPESDKHDDAVPAMAAVAYESEKPSDYDITDTDTCTDSALLCSDSETDTVSDTDTANFASDTSRDKQSSSRSTTTDNYKTQSKSSSSFSGIININTASAELLEELPGIGQVLSQRIVEYRETYGMFETTYSITNVRGIGDGIYAKIKDYITVDG